MVLVLFGAVFTGASVLIWLTDMQHPDKGDPMSPVGQFIFGAMFFGWAAGCSSWARPPGCRWDSAGVARPRPLASPCGRDSAPLYLELAAKLADQGTSEDAIPALDKAIEVDPRCVEAYVERGLQHWIGDRYEEAIADLTRAIELDPNNADAYMFRRMAYEDSDQPELAKADEERGVELQGE